MQQRVDSTKENILAETAKNKYFWKHRSETNLEFLRIHKKLQERYNAKQALMLKWMSILNTYRVMRMIHDTLVAKQCEKLRLARLKRDTFVLWRYRRDTAKAISRARKDKVLKAVCRVNLAQYQLKIHIANAKARDIVGELFVKMVVNAEFGRRLNRLSMRSEISSQ